MAMKGFHKDMEIKVKSQIFMPVSDRLSSTNMGLLLSEKSYKFIKTEAMPVINTAIVENEV